MGHGHAGSGGPIVNCGLYDGVKQIGLNCPAPACLPVRPSGNKTAVGTRKSKPTCSQSDCERVQYAKGLCHRHYQRQKAGLPLTPPRTRGTCTFEGCDLPHCAKGLCRGHYSQQDQGKPLTPLRQTRKTCSFLGCDKPHDSGGLCAGHRRQIRDGKSLSPLRPQRRKGSPPNPCSFQGCEKPAHSKGLCVGHYRQQKAGKPLQALRTRSPKTNTQSGCSFEGCNKDHYAKGLCQGHYHQQKTGRHLASLAKAAKGCSFEGCERPHEAKGLCKRHYEQQRQGRPLTPERKYQTTCSFEGCGREHCAKGLCAAHWAQQNRGHPLTEIERQSTDGECSFDGCSHPIKSKGLCDAHYAQQRSGKPLTVLIPANLSHEEAVAIAEKRWPNFEPNIDYPGPHEPWHGKCLNCNEAIKPRFSQSYRGGGCCSTCADFGIDYAAPGYFYVVAGEDYVKCGIANVGTIRDRLKTHKREFGLDKVLAKVHFSITSDAKVVENQWIDFVLNSPFRVGTRREYVFYHDEAVSFALALARGDDLPDAA